MVRMGRSPFPWVKGSPEFIIRLLISMVLACVVSRLPLLSRHHRRGRLGLPIRRLRVHQLLRHPCHKEQARLFMPLDC